MLERNAGGRGLPAWRYNSYREVCAMLDRGERPPLPNGWCLAFDSDERGRIADDRFTAYLAQARLPLSVRGPAFMRDHDRRHVGGYQILLSSEAFATLLQGAAWRAQRVPYWQQVLVASFDNLGNIANRFADPAERAKLMDDPSGAVAFARLRQDLEHIVALSLDDKHAADEARTRCETVWNEWGFGEYEAAHTSRHAPIDAAVWPQAA